MDVLLAITTRITTPKITAIKKIIFSQKMMRIITASKASGLTIKRSLCSALRKELITISRLKVKEITLRMLIFRVIPRMFLLLFLLIVLQKKQIDQKIRMRI